MSDKLTVGGKTYYEESYLACANETAARRGERITELERQLAEVILANTDLGLADAKVRDDLAEAQRSIAAMGRQLEADRTAVADGTQAAVRAIDSRRWLTEGRGTYEWDDDRWHGEFKAAAAEIREALDPLIKIAADWKRCPNDAKQVAAARIHLEDRISELEKACLSMAQLVGQPAVDGGLTTLRNAEARVAEMQARLTEARGTLENACLDRAQPGMPVRYGSYVEQQFFVAPLEVPNIPALEDALDELKAANLKVRDESAQAQALNRKWNTAMADAGLAGSEYFGDPTNCAARFRQLKDSIIQVHKQKAEAYDRIAELERQLSQARAHITRLEDGTIINLQCDKIRRLMELLAWADHQLPPADLKGYWGGEREAREKLSTGLSPAPADPRGDDLYMIQNTRSVVGNSALWWRESGHGYTCNVSEAWKVTKEQAARICRDRPEQDFPRRYADVLAQSELHFDVQRLAAFPAEPRPHPSPSTTHVCPYCNEGARLVDAGVVMDRYDNVCHNACLQKALRYDPK